MKTRREAQLSLDGVGPVAGDTPAPRRRAPRASMTARHCKALLAELDRVAQLMQRKHEEAEALRRATNLAGVFEAAVRAHEEAQRVDDLETFERYDAERLSAASGRRSASLGRSQR